MKSANDKAHAILEQLTAGLDEDGDAKKVDNAEGAFMAVHVDRLLTTPAGVVYAVSHYYEQNGDLCPDPSAEILKSKVDGRYYPLSLVQTFGRTVGATVDAAGELRSAPRVQAELAAFVGKWMRNVAAQQRIKATRAA